MEETKPNEVQGPSPAKMKAGIEKAWNYQAESYADTFLSDGKISSQFAPLHERLAAVVEESCTGQRVKILDVAASAGEPSLTMASKLPAALVTSTDIAEENVALGRGRAKAAGVTNMDFAKADGEDLNAYGDATFDVVCCSLALFMFPDWEAGLREFRRVLKPGGMLLFSTWGSDEKYDLGRLFIETATDMGMSTSFKPARLSDKAYVADTLEATGLSLTSMEDFNLPMAFPDAAAVVNGLLGFLLVLKEQGRADIIEEFTQAMVRRADSGGYARPGGEFWFPRNEIMIVVARK